VELNLKGFWAYVMVVSSGAGFFAFGLEIARMKKWI